MSFFNNVAEKIGKAAEVTANKAKEIAEITKLNAQISAEEKQIENSYMEIGKIIYEQSKGEGSADFVQIEDLCAKIKTSHDLIEEFKVKIQEVKNV